MVYITHIEDTKDLAEVRLPTGNDIFITLPKREPGGFSPFTPFHDIFLYLCNNPTTETW